MTPAQIMGLLQIWGPQWGTLNCYKISRLLSLLGTYSKEMKTGYQRDTCSPVFTTAFSTIAKIWKQPKCLSTDEWIKKWCIYTMDYYSAIRRKKEILPYATIWMDIEVIVLR